VRAPITDLEVEDDWRDLFAGKGKEAMRLLI